MNDFSIVLLRVEIPHNTGANAVSIAAYECYRLG